MALVAGLGVGLFILAFLWVLCLFICIGLSRAQGAMSYLGIVAVLVAIIVSLILWFLPRGPDTTAATGIVYDYTYAGRLAIVICTGIMLLVGLVAYVFLHVFEQHQAVVIKKTR